jgi:hypothetical protein
MYVTTERKIWLKDETFFVVYYVSLWTEETFDFEEYKKFSREYDESGRRMRHILRPSLK